MTGNWKIGIRAATVAAMGLVLIAMVVVTVARYRRPISLRGAVVREDSDTMMQSPIADVVVTAENGIAQEDAKTNFSGFFKMTLRPEVRRGRRLMLKFEHPDYRTVEMQETVGDQLYLVHMVPLHPETAPDPTRPGIVVTNVLVRYSTETTTEANIGTGAKTFQIVNKGNVPCKDHPPCSPDGRWQAAIASASLDAGQGNDFHDARVSCIAGACPFTKIEHDGFSRGGREISVSVLNWSDTTTFLLEAEAFQHQVSNVVRQAYPVILGRGLDFTLPPAAEGPTLEAQLDATMIVFPLGPSPILSWADCNVRVENDHSKSYRCVLKPGYRFR